MSAAARVAARSSYSKLRKSVETETRLAANSVQELSRSSAVDPWAAIDVGWSCEFVTPTLMPLVHVSNAKDDPGGGMIRVQYSSLTISTPALLCSRSLENVVNIDRLLRCDSRLVLRLVR